MLLNGARTQLCLAQSLGTVVFLEQCSEALSEELAFKTEKSYNESVRSFILSTDSLMSTFFIVITGIPNSTVWVYNAANHRYIPEILGADVGCGIAAFLINEVDPRVAADIIFEKLAGKGILGRGNHFVDICGAYESGSLDTELKPQHHILLVHTHGDNSNTTTPTTIQDAKKREGYAEQFREYLGQHLAHEISSSQCIMLGNWTHNSVEETEHGIIYRKGAVIARKEH